MNVKKTRVGLLTVILTVALMFSLFTVSAFAETTAASVPESTPVATPAATDESTPAATVESTPAASDESTPVASTESTPAASSESTPAATTGTSGDSGKKDNTDTIVSLIVGGVILVAIAVVCIIKREALAKFLRGLKSEMGKIVWLPKNQTLKNTIIVLIIVAICTIAIAILDIAFGQGIKFLDGIKK